MSTIDLVFAVLLSAGATSAPIATAAAPAASPSAAPAANASAAMSTAQRITLVAIAADVHACVLRGADGKLTRYAEGAALASGWRVTRVTAEGVSFTAAQRLAGQAVEARLRVDESIDLDAQSAALSALATPVPQPRHVQLIPQKRQPAAQH